MSKEDPDLSKEQSSGDAELYAKLMPYILRDFIHKNDLNNLIRELMMSLGQFNFFINTDSNSEGIKTALLYKELLDNGTEDINEKIKPVIEI